MNEIPAFSAVILNGGKSSRAKVHNKGLLKIGDETIMESIYRKLSRLFKEITIISNDADEIRKVIPGAVIIHDETESTGPASGIWTALNNVKSQRCFICACDMPFLVEALISCLIEASAGFDITCPVHDGFSEPLCAVYDVKCLPHLSMMIKGEAKPKVTNLFSLVRTQFIDCGKLPFEMDPECFTNVNTPEDYERALEVYRHRTF